MEMFPLATRTALPVHAVILDAETGDFTERTIIVDGTASTAADAIEAVRAAGLDVVTEGGLVEPNADDTAWLVTIEDPKGFAGATIEVNIDRHTIDPEGLASDEEVSECVEHILDAVREAFPGAEVRTARGSTMGVSRNGEDLTDRVRTTVNAAFSGFFA